MVRILVYTGKGGVGKTSIAAASAILCATRGYRTIVLSTDIAHSLADAFEIELGPEPKELAPNLWALEPDVCEDRVAEIEARLAELERAPRLRERGRSLMDRVIPREASHHFRNAGREELLGIRAIVDFWIDRIDEAEGRAGSGPRRESIEIE